jgi:hypothetical protein
MKLGLEKSVPHEWWIEFMNGGLNQILFNS